MGHTHIYPKLANVKPHFSEHFAIRQEYPPSHRSTMQSSHDVVFGDPLKPVKLDDFRNVLIR